ncbi:MAG TPA: GTPase ObgE [Candidatus Limnocylindrales bacterium]|nr:GTPase ObgE [Candidatus Limnocylindrales bacterium]
MNFVDEARLRIVAGDGGDGCVAFLREKYRPKGGPSGGDGGNGGSVYVVGDLGLSTLLDLRFRNLVKAGRGEDGRGKNQHGKNGGDEVLKVPVGTMIFDAQTGELLADVTVPGDIIRIAAGGVGGRGNARFATATHQAPRRADPGTPGVELEVRLELRLLADAGLVGLPNAGKSSLLARLSAARPKIADYPFTTLVPVLGVVSWADEKSFVLADIPGLIEGAHEGAGLGDRFLRHVQRTALLVHLIDCTGISAQEALASFDTVNRELAAYSNELAERPQIVVATKMDLPEVAERVPELRALLERRGLELHAISSATGAGTRELVLRIGREVEKRRKLQAAAAATNEPGE